MPVARISGEGAACISCHTSLPYALVEPETRQAFENMWAEQIQAGPAAGRWHWIQANLVPWEVADSDLWGASVACVAAGIFPELAPPDNLRLLHETLRRAASDDEVSLHVKSAILWCDAETGGSVLEDGAAERIASNLLDLQRDDGGWALRELGPWTGWEGSRSDCCGQREIRPDAYATGFVTLALARNPALLGDEGGGQLDNAVAWIERQLANPYPEEPRYNTHDTGDDDLPEFRNNLYTNAGHMWAYLAKDVHSEQSAPWARK